MYEVLVCLVTYRMKNSIRFHWVSCCNIYQSQMTPSLHALNLSAMLSSCLISPAHPTHQTKTPQNSALLPPLPSSSSHCTKNRSTTRLSNLPLKLNPFTLAKLSAYIVLHLPLLLAPLTLKKRRIKEPRMTITAVAGPLVMMRSGRSAAACS
jgi:hypothetical protein